MEAGVREQDPAGTAAGQDANGHDPEATAEEVRDGLVIEGLQGQLGFNVGGKKPTSSTLKIVGGRVDLPKSSVQKGETIVVRAVLQVGEVGFVDQLDKATGQVVSCERRHKARIIDIGVEE